MSPPRPPTLHAIVLAAGASSRFGSPKQLVRFERQPLVSRVLSSASEVAGAAVSIVLGAHAAEVAATIPSGSASIIVNREWPEGIASSIRAAVARLPGACQGALILLADQPLISSESLNRLVATWRRRPRSIVASHYGAVTGVRQSSRAGVSPIWQRSVAIRAPAYCCDVMSITWCGWRCRRPRWTSITPKNLLNLQP